MFLLGDILFSLLPMIKVPVSHNSDIYPGFAGFYFSALGYKDIKCPSILSKNTFLFNLYFLASSYDFLEKNKNLKVHRFFYFYWWIMNAGLVHELWCDTTNCAVVWYHKFELLTSLNMPLSNVHKPYLSTFILFILHNNLMFVPGRILESET